MRGASVLASTAIEVTSFAPGLFTMNGDPGGPVLVEFGGSVVPMVGVGDAVTIYCEGLGPTSPPVNAGAVPTGTRVRHHSAAGRRRKHFCSSVC